MRDALREQIRRLNAFHGPMSTRTTRLKLDEIGAWDEEWVAGTLGREKDRIINELYREDRPDGLPSFIQTAEADEDEGGHRWVQPDFGGVEDWRFEIDKRAAVLVGEAEKLLRIIDAFENKFGFRYVPEPCRRIAGLVYDDEAAVAGVGE